MRTSALEASTCWPVILTLSFAFIVTLAWALIRAWVRLVPRLTSSISFAPRLTSFPSFVLPAISSYVALFTTRITRPLTPSFAFSFKGANVIRRGLWPQSV